jgi:hypothetical protein
MVNSALMGNLDSTPNGLTSNGELSPRRGGTHRRTRVACQMRVAKLFQNAKLQLRFGRPHRGQRSHSKSRRRIYSTASCVLRTGFGSFASVTCFINSTPSTSSVRQITRHTRPSSRVICNTNSSGMVPARTPVICAPPFEKLLRMQGRAKWRSESWIVARQFHSSGKFFRRSCAICLSRWLVICLLRAGLLLTTG